MEHHARETAYRHYVTRSLQLIPQGMYISKSLNDLFEPQPDFDPEEVIEQVMSHF